MKKFTKLFLSLVSLCLFAFSCSLETVEDQSGSISITLPGNAAVLRTTSSGENPTNYYIALFYGKNATVQNAEGKVGERHADAGEKIHFTKLKPGPYTLYVKGDAPFCYYEKSHNVIVNPGQNPVSIDLGTKHNKARVIIDLSKLENVETFDFSITNINKEILFGRKNVDINSVPNNKIYIPFGFMPGTYKIDFTSPLASEERYYMEGGNTFVVPYSESEINITKTITSRPIKTFIVDATRNLQGDGSVTSPFNSLSYAIDKAIGSTDTVHEDINIVVQGKVTEENPIIINNGVTLSLVGRNGTSSHGIIEGSFVVDNANVSVENLHLTNPNSLQEVKRDSFTLKNGANLILKNNVLIEYGFFLNDSSTLTLGNVNDVSSILGTLKLDSYEENKKIITILDPNTVITGLPLVDGRFEVTQEGTVIKKKEYASISLNIDPIKEGKSIEVKYYKESTPEKFEIETLETNKQQLLNPLSIGDVYVFELKEKNNSGTSAELIPVGLNKITISTNLEENTVLLNYIYENYNYYVDSLNGDDRLNSGITASSPFESLERAISDIQFKSETYNSKPYNIVVNGDLVGKQNIQVSNINHLIISGKSGISASNIKQTLTINNSHVTLIDIGVDKAELTSSSLSFEAKQGSVESSTRVSDIVINDDKSLIQVLNKLTHSSDVMNINLAASLYKDGFKVVDVSSITDKPNLAVLEFELMNPEWRLDDNGIIRTNSNLTINLDITPEDSSRYTLVVRKASGEKIGEYLLSSQSNVINNYFTPDVSYNIKLIDNYDYNKVLLTKDITISSTNPNIIDLILNRSVYVTYNGNDNNNGRSKNNGFKTLSKAYEVINAQANGDIENTYSIVVVPDPTVVNDPDNPKSIPILMEGLGSITVDSPIKLKISGVLPRSEFDADTMMPWIKVEQSETFITVNNDKADVTLDFSVIKVPGDKAPIEPTVPPLFEIIAGNLTIGETACFQYMPNFLIESTQPDLNLIKRFIDVGNGTTASSVTLMKCGYFGQNDSDYFNYIKLYPQGCIKVPPTYCEGVNYKKQISLDQDLILSNSNPLVKTTDGSTLTIEMATEFVLINPNTFDQNYDKYLTSSGVFADKKSFTYNITNLPQIDSPTTDFVSDRNYRLAITQNEYSVVSDERITKSLGNVLSTKLCPDYNYELRIITYGDYGPINIATKDFIFKPDSSLDIPLFTVNVKNPDSSSSGNEIQTALKDITRYLKNSQNVYGFPTITNAVNVVLNLNGENYKENDCVFDNYNIPLPDNFGVNIKIQKDVNASKAKITLNNNQLVSQTDNINPKHSITFENISFEANISAPSISTPIFNITTGNWKFKNIDFTNLVTTTDSVVFVNLVNPANVILDGNINIHPCIIKLNKDATPSTECSAISVNSAITITNNNLINIGVYSSDGTEDYTGNPYVLKGTRVDIEYNKFKLNNPTYYLNGMGQVKP